MSGNLVQAMGDAYPGRGPGRSAHHLAGAALPSALSAMMVFLLCIGGYYHRRLPGWPGSRPSRLDRPARHRSTPAAQLRHRTWYLHSGRRHHPHGGGHRRDCRPAGKVDVWLDRTLPPWSIYRMLQGTTFLLNMAVMLNAGIRPYDSLASMIKISRLAEAAGLPDTA